MSDNAAPGNLTAPQQKALEALLSEPTVIKAATLAEVSQPTLYRWLRDATFQAAYRQARREVVQHAISRLQQASSAAVETLLSIMKNTKAPAAARISAARTILEMSVKAVELEDVIARLERLEAKEARYAAQQQD